MSQPRNKNVIYLKWEAISTFYAPPTYRKETSVLSFPYPPIYQDEQTDYLCFTTDKTLHSKFWTIRYVTDFCDPILSDTLSAYENILELLPNQVQIGSLYQECLEYPPIVDIPELSDIPKFSKIPGILFDKKNFSPTKDENGNYLFTKNPVFSGGPYHGRSLLLTIGVPVSNQIETIERCLSRLTPLLEKLPSELLVIDTGSTDGTLDVCKRYGARIVSFPWCDNMSAVRNTGIYHALGDWYLSIDDDEWFEDVEGILSFFQTKTYQNYEFATYIQRNYNTSSGETWSDNHTIRMAKITPELHFEGRIHDALVIPDKKRLYQIFSYVHHYGFIKDIPEKSKIKYIRNVSSLLYDLYEYPTSFRYNYQLAKEFNEVEDYTLAVAYLIRGLSMEKENPDPYFGKNHASHLLATLYNSKNPALFPIAKVVANSYCYTPSEKAFFAHIKMSLGLQLKKDPDEMLSFYQEYLMYKKQFEKNPNNSLFYTSIGLEVCTNIQYFIDAHTIAFCAYFQKGEQQEALKKLTEIDFQNILFTKESFIQCFLNAPDEIYQPCIEKLSPAIIELWSYQILSILLESLHEAERPKSSEAEKILKRQQERLSYFLKQFSIDAINRFFFRTKLIFDTKIRNTLCHTAVLLDKEKASVQEIFFYSFLLRCRFAKETDEEKRMNDFIAYVQLIGAFAKIYYQPDLLNGINYCVITRDILSAYHIYLALYTKDKPSVAISHLRIALKIFPGGFQKEIQTLLQEILKPKPDPVMDELTKLTAQIKENAKELIAAGRASEAIQILKELQEYAPADIEVIDLLNMLEEE